MNLNEQQIEAIARACHEANRAWCLLHGDTSQVGWDEAPAEFRTDGAKQVRQAIAGEGPEAQHQSWYDSRIAAGWTYGPVKDVVAKTNPALVPYADLPAAQKAKDTLFIRVVEAFECAFDFA